VVGVAGIAESSEEVERRGNALMFWIFGFPGELTEWPSNMLRKSWLSRHSTDGSVCRDAEDTMLVVRSSCVEGTVLVDRKLNLFVRP